MLCISIAPKAIDENSRCVYRGLESSVLQTRAKNHLLSFGVCVQIHNCVLCLQYLSKFFRKNIISKPPSYNLALRGDKINLVSTSSSPQISLSSLFKYINVSMLVVHLPRQHLCLCGEAIKSAKPLPPNRPEGGGAK